jgi:hypothetical protein
MAEIKPDWYPAVNVRCSKRSYDKSRPMGSAVREKLHAACADFKPYPGARAVFVSEPPDDIFANAMGFYGNIKNAPSFLAFIGDMSDLNVQEKMGYTGEGIILEATSLGLGTCWVALTYNSKSVSPMIKLAGNEKLLAVSPVGYTVEKWTFEGPQWPKWARAAAEAARLAPSATNRQPWNLTIGKDSITISIKSTGMDFNVSKRLDCGIAMLHIELGALSCGVHGYWELLKKPQVARFKIR